MGVETGPKKAMGRQKGGPKIPWGAEGDPKPPPNPTGHRRGPQNPLPQPPPLTSVMSREAAAALMCRLGCRMELLQSRARAKVPTALKRGKKKKNKGGVRGTPNLPGTPPISQPGAPPHRATTRNWSICRSVRGLSGSHTFISIFCWFLLSDSPSERQEDFFWGGGRQRSPPPCHGAPPQTFSQPVGDLSLVLAAHADLALVGQEGFLDGVEDQRVEKTVLGGGGAKK